MSLTNDAVARINSRANPYDFQPTLQVVELAQLPNNRFKVSLSDGDRLIDAYLNQQCQNLLKENKLVPNQTIKLTDYILTSNNGQNFLSLNNFEAGPVIKQLIGSPNGVKPVAKSKSDFMPIRVLTTLSSDWVIKGRINSKTPQKNFGGNRPGKLFSIIIIDHEGTEVEGTFFNDAVDMFYGRLEQGKTYTFSCGYVKLASQQFRKCDFDYQISFDRKSIIKEVEDDGEIAELKLNLVPLSDLKNLPDKKIVDVIGVIVDIMPVTDIMSKAGEKLLKRNLKIMDQSQAMVELTLWNEDATRPELEVNIADFPVLVGNKVRISYFGGISLTTDRSLTKILIDPPGVDAVQSLKNYMRNSQGTIDAVDLTVKDQRANRPNKTLKEIKEYWETAELGMKEEIYQVRAFVGFIKRDDKQAMSYESCKNNKCKKKVNMESDGFYHCNSCRESFEKSIPRYILAVRIHDTTESMFVTAFDEIGNNLLKMSAENLIEMMGSDENGFENIMAAPMQKEFTFGVKAQVSASDRGGARTKYSLMSIREVNQREASDRILAEIQQMLAIN